ncbi:protein-disulfide reductase DsbD domain-containing protein [Flavivirga spongiicola]|uniref:Protein-disulfide reductase DsbD family protein n=1 Tax=Flavivirga spongiicola TaxID=421621 RepID=A0ABU7XZ40_9FLAO|nr:protein-disulfide reductase DsbD domain-containing protein [Flavivirga sp. MEBiC05379]MDO5980818.1 protein-disulfide reductase DsbD family protein [Flavivirga sp. MEBiC05379]
MKNLFGLYALFLSLTCLGQEAPQTSIYSSVIDNIQLKQTTSEEPVSMNATLVKSSISEGETTKLIVKTVIHNNWHIYAYVPEGGYFIQSELKIEVPEGITVNLIKEPKIKGYEADPNIMIYKGNLIFVYELDGKFEAGEHPIKATLTFQPCDPYHCLAPNEISKELKLTVN